jgi:hypothetical protein
MWCFILCVNLAGSVSRYFINTILHVSLRVFWMRFHLNCGFFGKRVSLHNVGLIRTVEDLNRKNTDLPWVTRNFSSSRRLDFNCNTGTLGVHACLPTLQIVPASIMVWANSLTEISHNLLDLCGESWANTDFWYQEVGCFWNKCLKMWKWLWK